MAESKERYSFRSRSAVTNGGEAPKKGPNNETSKATSDIHLFDEEEKKWLAGPEGAAVQSRLPVDKMSDEEAEAFKDLPACAEKAFVEIRNLVLELWINNPKKELTAGTVLKKLGSKFDKGLVSRVHAYLDRYGFINFGIFEVLSSPTEPNGTKVIVIGAGVAGLAAAQQLKRFGFEVVVVEANSRVGGRISTDEGTGYLAEQGAMEIPGLGGNPLLTISKQIPLRFFVYQEDFLMYQPYRPKHQWKPTKPIYMLKDGQFMNKLHREHSTGKKEAEKVWKKKEKLAETEAYDLLECAEYVRAELEEKGKDTGSMSLNEALEFAIQQQEKIVTTAHLKNLQERLELEKKNVKATEDLLRAREDLKVVCSRLKDLKKGDDEQMSVAMIASKKAGLLEEKDLCKVAIAQCKDKLKEIDEMLFKNSREDGAEVEVYLSLHERNLVEWYFANMEYYKGAPLSKLSLKYWEKEEEFEFFGRHVILLDGFSQLTRALSSGLDIRLNAQVEDVITLGCGATAAITTSATEEANKTFTADAILCTLPLGVMQYSVDCFDKTPIAIIPAKKMFEENAVRFVPPLPSWKTGALRRLGCGIVNKVILTFETAFWDKKWDLFGNAPMMATSRGELCLFWSLSTNSVPVLIGIMAGEAAETMEDDNDEVVVGRCMRVLKTIFGEKATSKPEKAVVTRWKRHAFARGSHSYVTMGSSPDDFDLLAAPVGGHGHDMKEAPTPAAAMTPTNRPHVLYFAGEHTSRKYSGTVHGALLSGLREAGRIADEMIGRSYDPPRDKHENGSHMDVS